MRCRAHPALVFVSAGFTLIEMLVVLAIIGIISLVVITSQSNFNKTLLLANTAYDVALTIRSAETYGISSRVAGTSFNTGYGVHFERQSPNNTFTFFADSWPSPSSNPARCHPATDTGAPDAKPGNCVYDPQPNKDVLITTYTLGNGVTFGDLCVYTNSWSCATSHGSLLASLDIVFIRPNPTPFMTGCTTGACSYDALVPVTQACLKLVSPQGGERFISVDSSGEIRATAASCP